MPQEVIAAIETNSPPLDCAVTFVVITWPPAPDVATAVPAVPIEAAGCELEEPMASRYRVRAKFGESVVGYEAFALARDIYRQGQSPAASAPP